MASNIALTQAGQADEAGSSARSYCRAGRRDEDAGRGKLRMSQQVFLYPAIPGRRRRSDVCLRGRNCCGGRTDAGSLSSNREEWRVCSQRDRQRSR